MTRGGLTQRLTLHRDSAAARMLLAAAALLASARALPADGSASHTVTVRVTPVSAVAITGGDLELAISPGGTTTGPATASDATTCDLHWVTNQTNQKITVASNLGSPRFTLKVEALNVTGARASGEVTLNTASQDFLLDVSAGKGKCDLSYTAVVTDLLATASDVHTITYTITDVR